MYFDFPGLLVILIINCHSNLQEKLSLLVQILLNGEPKFNQEDLTYLFKNIFELICFYSIKLTTYDDRDQDKLVDEMLETT